MSAIPKSVPKKLAQKVAHYDDERSIGNSIIVSLKDGFKFSRDPFANCHVEGFDNVKDVIAGLHDTEPCGCEECVPG